MSNLTVLTVFYDGYCPLCVKEMKQLAKKDKQGYLAFYDINQKQLADEHPEIDFAKANAYLHAKTSDGQIVTGLDVTYLTWKLVGLGWVIAPLRWPIIRVVADKLYMLFANNRYRVSKWLTGKARCDSSCAISTKVSANKEEQDGTS